MRVEYVMSFGLEAQVQAVGSMAKCVRDWQKILQHTHGIIAMGGTWMPFCRYRMWTPLGLFEYILEDIDLSAIHMK